MLGQRVALLYLAIQGPPSLGPCDHLQGQSHCHIWVLQRGEGKACRGCMAGHIPSTHASLRRLGHVTSPTYEKGWGKQLLAG